MHSYWKNIWSRFVSRPWGVFGLSILVLYFLVAIFAPFLASSKPIVVVYDGTLYFPLFRYLLASSYYTKAIDLFYNTVALFSLPFLATWLLKGTFKIALRVLLATSALFCFIFFSFFYVADPSFSSTLNRLKQERVLELAKSESDQGEGHVRYELPSWDFDLEYMNSYARLNLLINQRTLQLQHEKLVHTVTNPYTLYQIEREQELEAIKRLQEELVEDRGRYEKYLKNREKADIVEAYEERENRLQYIYDKRAWIEKESKRISLCIMPLIRNFHWEDDAGGEQALNLQLPFYEQTRTTRKDLLAALIFGSRISLFVGFLAVGLALGIGIPLGLISGFYGARLDITLSRFVEVWEALPAFFMLLLIVTMLQTKSIFLIISVISIFGWTGSFRFVRAETFRQRELPYVDATKALGFGDFRILCGHILPNALLVVLALLPFDIMSAITQEAGLAFLGLGEEQSCSWGVLMDEARAVFPAESNLLWPPAIVLTTLLIAIAFVGEALQWAMNPKAAR